MRRTNLIVLDVNGMIIVKSRQGRDFGLVIHSSYLGKNEVSHYYHGKFRQIAPHDCYACI